MESHNASATAIDTARARTVLAALREGLTSAIGDAPESGLGAIACRHAGRRARQRVVRLVEVEHAAQVWCAALAPDAVDAWLDGLEGPEGEAQPQTLGIVMAGNIPFVGLHDLICGVVSGHRSSGQAEPG